MARNKRARDARPGPAGFLVVDKPADWTSHDVVNAARRWLGTRRVGHLGTLDPQATGVLPLAVREATKLVPYFEGGEKHYLGTVRMGAETDTLDGEGQVLRRHEGPLPDEAAVVAALAGFRGDIEQIPPMYSAVKQQGVPLHRLARKGQEVVRPPKKVRIHKLELLRYSTEGGTTDADIRVECSQGTYVRSLAADLGQALGCGAYLASLRRVASGPFVEAEARTVQDLAALADEGKIDDFIAVPSSAMGMSSVTLPEAGCARIAHGGDIPAGTLVRAQPGDRMMALDPDGKLVAVLEMRPDRRLWPLRVLRPAE